jgi:hypothetical protein
VREETANRRTFDCRTANAEVQSWNPISVLRHSPFDCSTFVGSLFLRFRLCDGLDPQTLAAAAAVVSPREDFLKNMLCFPFGLGYTMCVKVQTGMVMKTSHHCECTLSRERPQHPGQIVGRFQMGPESQVRFQMPLIQEN